MQANIISFLLEQKGQKWFFEAWGNGFISDGGNYWDHNLCRKGKQRKTSEKYVVLKCIFKDMDILRILATA